MSEDTAIRVDFGKPMALFPLDGVVLLPQQAIPLHIFEPRYRQMIGHALDGSGQIALASFEGDRWKQEYHGRPPLRPAVCVAQIVQHEKTDDGRFAVMVQGVCRAKIVEEMPAEEGRLYREARLEPVGLDEDADPQELEEVRTLLDELLSEGPLTRMAAAGPVLRFIRDPDVPAAAILELAAVSLIHRQDLLYRLLQEAELGARARLVLDELSHLESLIKRAEAQGTPDAPKGVSWN